MFPRPTSARFFHRAALSGSPRLTSRQRKLPVGRYALLILLTLGAVSVWSFWGGQLMASLNPVIRMQLHLLTPALDAWITPPEYTGLPPVMIATPAGARYDGPVIDVPAGSTITAHLAEHDGDAPDLFVNGEKTAFISKEGGDFEVAQPVRSGDMIAIRRGWQDMGSWRIRVVPDQAPHVAFAEPPSITERKSVRLSYEATDDYGVASVVARITPRASAPGVDNIPVEISLASPDAKDLRRVSFEDFTAYAWAGQPVQIQLIATDAAGHRAESDSVDFVMPERTFFHPLARVLIEERRKLLLDPNNEATRNEAANIMAGIAHEPATFHGDAVVLMTLRTGAVRLVLDHGSEAAAPVNELLWQAAVRIEDGTVGIAERRLHEAQRELADALDRKASGSEIQGLVDHLREALASYLSALSMRVARPGTAEGLTQAFGVQTNMLAPRDMDRMLEKIRDLSASGSTGAARDELLQLEQRLETLRNGHASFSEEMHRRSGTASHPEGAHNSIERLLQNF